MNSLEGDVGSKTEGVVAGTVSGLRRVLSTRGPAKGKNTSSCGICIPRGGADPAGLRSVHEMSKVLDRLAGARSPCNLPRFA